jgi:2-dehydropantoate 2-reductase
MRIAVMGTGGIGGYYGGLLARAGNEVTCIARGEHLRAIRQAGLVVRSKTSGDFTVHPAATDDPSEVGPVDLVLFCVKSYDTESAAGRIRPLIGPETLVLSLQNGIDNEERIARVVGAEHVLGGVCFCSAHVHAPGVVTEGGVPPGIVFGELPQGTSARAERLLAVFEAAGIPTTLHPDVRVAMWEKFVTICGSASLNALTRLPQGIIYACPETRGLVEGAMAEAIAVGRAAGVNLPDDCLEQQLARQARVAPTQRSSLYVDLAAGRRLEIDALNGTLVRLGREHGVQTPLNFAIYAALKPWANGPPKLPEG